MGVRVSILMGWWWGISALGEESRKTLHRKVDTTLKKLFVGNYSLCTKVKRTKMNIIAFQSPLLYFLCTCWFDAVKACSIHTFQLTTVMRATSLLQREQTPKVDNPTVDYFQPPLQVSTVGIYLWLLGSIAEGPIHNKGRNNPGCIESIVSHRATRDGTKQDPRRSKSAFIHSHSVHWCFPREET